MWVCTYAYHFVGEYRGALVVPAPQQPVESVQLVVSKGATVAAVTTLLIQLRLPVIDHLSGTIIFVIITLANHHLGKRIKVVSRLECGIA